MCRLNTPTQKWNVYEGKFEIVPFVLKFRPWPAPMLISVFSSRYEADLTVCMLFYYRFNGIAAISIVTKPEII